jgi:FtsZ-interacting cell division protein YlmF
MKLNLKKWLTADEELKLNGGDTFYAVGKEESLGDDGSTKMILLEPRAFSEATQIVDFLRQRNTVVVNLKRVTKDQAKRIMDFLSGANYAIDGKIEKIGGGIFLCTPNNVNIQGQITDENDGKDIHNNNDINLEW